ncbi:NADH-quinone oxidoreductase subunit NuoK [Hydrogenibacillus schlegelii]|uniref:NADH-quinone oxidoreductase subunit K n=1 Tax=Hydrogenibacillus schlegelii TaxID=1484 RepID=A0A132MG65_HYDSH|nr:NADH-quinone oxidoreductase subunit NuoK [Hydrogenibacillus schlegelii]KWW96832.1 hypothetical protein TR75_12120 [Hydrogenibacillus schlegelii]MBT9281411.1 NADH-quinone oxidoreductase subunit NuoK [Hydrogenibacillus schlegelii]OAR04735.1 hypothetical protein SA87_09495 [Hydrogenibacillus schlegelii]PTQ54991.1 MAG: NADH-ubiquinone oxidoreductase chain K [Hydrogenibacillus schlegelii]
MIVHLSQYVLLAGLLFSLGLYAALTRRNAVIVLLSVELMMAAALVVLVAFGRFGSPAFGWLTADEAAVAREHALALFILAVAAAEVAVGLAILIALYRLKATANVDEHETLKH